MKKHMFKNLLHFSVLFSVLMLFAACKKEETPGPGGNNNNNGGGGGGGTANKALIIENGARTLSPDMSMTYTAYFVSADGSVSTPASVSWSSSKTEVVEINNAGGVTIKGTGVSTITATAVDNGVTYTATVPVGIRVPGVFAVAPSAVIIGSGTSLQFETVFFGQGNPTYTFSSNNTNVVSVSSSGLATFNANGQATITVTISTQPENPFEIPVLVVGPPSVPLPVTRVQVTPGSGEIFRQETLQFSAKAFDGNNTEVSRTFEWSVSDPTVASINSSGLLTGLGIGNVTVFAKTDGIIGQAEAIVSPDTIIFLSPISVSLAAGATQQFTPTVYNIRTNTTITGLTNFTWSVPTYGIPVFDVATVNSTGLVTMRQNAMAGLMTFVECSLPSPTIMPGVSAITVAINQGEDCGAGNPDVATINVLNGSTFNLNVSTNPTVALNVEALDALGDPVSNPALKFNSSNALVANVDFDGNISAVGEGTATITICSGNFATKTVTVNVSLF